MDFIITITDDRKLAGISAAAKAYNETNSETPNFVPLSDAEYVSFVMDRAAESYANSYGVPKA